MDRVVYTQEQLKKKALARLGRGDVALESKLQSECVLWFKNLYPELGRRLFAVFNEGKDVTHKMAMGLTPGVCDLLYVGENGMLYGIEMKQKGSQHNVQHLLTQASWMMEVLPGRAYFCDSLESFKSIMLPSFEGVDAYLPEDVYEYCKTLKVKNVQWDEISNYLKEKKTSARS